jgi:hypothetical protein
MHLFQVTGSTLLIRIRPCILTMMSLNPTKDNKTLPNFLAKRLQKT